MSKNLLVLGDSIVHSLLISLSRSDIIKFQGGLQNALIDFSTGNEREYQPAPDFINRPTGQKTLFRAFTSPDAVGTKIIVTPAPVADATGAIVNPPLRGVLSLCDSSGFPTSLINAEEVTGYRTTLSALIPYMWRRHTAHIVIFGAGKQALWHCRLALALRGEEIESVTIINRSTARAVSLVQQVREENEKYWKSPASLVVLDAGQADYSERLNAALASADAVFCTVGSTSPLFQLDDILGSGSNKRLRAPFVSAIGSWQADMIELDPEMLKYAASHRDSYSPHDNGLGSILVDDRDECLIKSGEVIQSALAPERMIEVGEILSWQRQERETQSGEQRERRERWLSEGFVVYKGIGVSLTDLAAANTIVALAREREVGVSVPGF